MVYLDIKLIKINSRMRMKKQLFCEFLGILKDSHSFFDLCGLGNRGTQMAQMTLILTCSVWDFADFGIIC